MVNRGSEETVILVVTGVVVKRGDRVRVKLLANVETWFRGRTATVVADSAPGEVVLVEFDDEAVAHHFVTEDLERIN
jgi:hypothetical protein